MMVLMAPGCTSTPLHLDTHMDEAHALFGDDLRRDFDDRARAVELVDQVPCKIAFPDGKVLADLNSAFFARPDDQLRAGKDFAQLVVREDLGQEIDVCEADFRRNLGLEDAVGDFVRALRNSSDMSRRCSCSS